MTWLTPGFQTIDLAIDNPNYQGSLQLRESTAEFEYFIAKSELEKNENLTHEMSHLAQLLTYIPNNSEWLDLLEKYLDRAPENPESLLSEECRNYYAIEAIRAYIYAKQERLLEALRILDAISTTLPETLYMDTWGIDWLSKSGAMEFLDTGFVGAILATTLNCFGEFKNITCDRQQYLLKYAELTKKYLELQQKNNDKQSNSIMQMTYVGFLRKAGCFRQALGIAQQNYRDNPDWFSATAMGLVLREMEQTDAAEKIFRQAIKYDPQNMSIKLEIGDMYFNLGNWQKAKQVYQEVPKNTPQFDWAYASILYCDWKMQPEQPYPDKLLQLISGDSPNDRASQFIRQFYPYTGYLPEPSDAQANCLRMMIEKDVSYGKFTVSCLESPSNDLAVKLAFGEGVHLEVEVENIPQPDPRLAIEPVAYKLWEYEDTKATPALPSPNPKVLDTIANLVSSPLELQQFSVG